VRPSGNYSRESKVSQHWRQADAERDDVVVETQGQERGEDAGREVGVLGRGVEAEAAAQVQVDGVPEGEAAVQEGFPEAVATPGMSATKLFFVCDGKIFTGAADFLLTQQIF